MKLKSLKYPFEAFLSSPGNNPPVIRTQPTVTKSAFAVAMLLGLGVVGAYGQNTYTYSGANGGSWIRTTNWTGGAPSKTPGVDANSSTTVDGATNDIAAINSSSTILSLGINFNTSTNNGVTANGAANQLLTLGAITFSTGPSAGNFLIGNNSTSLDGVLTLTGVTIGADSNVILRNSSGSGLTLANAQGSGSKLMGVALANTTDNQVVITGAGDITVSSIISGTSRNLTLNATGTGRLVLSGANTYTGTTTITAGRLVYGASNVISTGAVTVNGSTAVLDMGANRTDTVGTVSLDGGSITGTGTSALTSTGSFEMKSGSVTAGLSGTGIALNKTTSGIVTLSGTNTYTGATTVSAGTLLVNGALGNTATSVSSAATLGGTGTIGGAVTVASGGFLSPGASIESLGVASLNLGGTLLVEWDTTVSPNIDLLSVTGLLNLGGSSAVSFSNLGTGSLDLNTPYVFATYGVGGLTGTFGTVSNLPSGFTLDYNYGGLNQIAIVPEPSSVLLTFAFAGVPLLRRNRRRSA